MKKKDELKELLLKVLTKLEGFEDRIKKLEEVSHKQATMEDVKKSLGKIIGFPPYTMPPGNPGSTGTISIC